MRAGEGAKANLSEDLQFILTVIRFTVFLETVGIINHSIFKALIFWEKMKVSLPSRWYLKTSDLLR
jgi:hypothetical protein